MSDAVIGKEVDGYRIQSVLGRGGMGTVYKAEDVNLSRTVAIKRINPGQQERESFIHRFRSEAQALARIDSPHIVGVYALRETDIGLLIVMEYVEGGTLKDPVERDGALPPNQAVPILEQTLQAFHDAHSAGVIHRDIKPENVMLTKDGMVKVTDFGIAKLRQPDSGETVTQGGQGGTLKYMSPEQISNISAVDARSDIYSLGMTAYKVLAGTLPFKESDTDFDIMRKVVEGEIPPPDEFNSDIPSGLAQWVVGAIQKQQDDRYQSAEEMLEALRDADEQAGDVTRTQPGWEVDDGSTDVDETQTVVPGDEEQTQTVVPGGEDEDTVDPDGETVMDMDAGAATGEPGAARPPAPEAPAATEPNETDETNWVLVGGGIAAALLVVAGAVFAFVQMGGGTQAGGGSGAAAALSLTTTPAGATVVVNDDTVGAAPLDDYSLDAGAVEIEVFDDGRRPWDTTFTVAGGDVVTLPDVRLVASDAGRDDNRSTGAVADAQQTSAATAREPSPADPSPSEEAASTGSASQTGETTEEPSPEETTSEPATGTVDVTLRPIGTVLVDGRARGTGGTIQVPAGEHTVACRHPQGGSTERTLTVGAGETQVLTCYTEHTVNVNTEGPWGRILVNGEDAGKNTNAGGALSLPPGTHRIEVRRRTIDNFRVDGGQVRIERGDESRIENFSGTSYQVEVEPTFEPVEYAIVFNVEEG